MAGDFIMNSKRFFLEREPVDIPISHPIFRCFFKIDELMQIPGTPFYLSVDGHTNDSTAILLTVAGSMMTKVDS